MVDDIETEIHCSAGTTAADIAVRGTGLMAGHAFGKGRRGFRSGSYRAAAILKGADKR